MKTNDGLRWWVRRAAWPVWRLWGAWLLAAAGGEALSAGERLTVEDAIRQALARNPEARASAARVEMALGRAEQAGRWANPELEWRAEDWPLDGGRGFADAKQTIGLTQTLPYPGKKSLDTRLGRAGVKVSEAALAVRRTELVREVKVAFYRVLASERLVGVSGELVAAAGASAEAVQKRVEAGAAAYPEQLRAEVLREQAGTELRRFESERALARQALARWVGRPEEADFTLEGTLAEEPRAGLIEGGSMGWMAQHPEVVAARVEVERAGLAGRRARLEPYPDVRLSVAGGRNGETDQPVIELGVSLPLPILDRGRGAQREARAGVAVAEAELTAVQQQLRRGWGQACERYRMAAEQVGRYRERIVPRAEEALRLVRAGFESGKFGYTDLVDTQRTTAEVRLAYQYQLLELAVAGAGIEALLEPQPLPGTASTQLE